MNTGGLAVVRRTALVTGVGEFQEVGVQGEPTAWSEDPPERLDFVPDRMNRVSIALTAVGFEVHTTQPHPGTRALREHMTTACVSPSDAVLIHFVGHGTADEDRRLRILGADLMPGSLGSTSLNVGALIEDLELDAGPPVLMLLDVCQAGTAARTQALAHGTHRRVWVIGATGHGATAHHGRFSMAVAETLHLLRSGEVDLHPSLPYVPLRTFANLVEQQLHRLCRTDDVLPQWLEMTPEFAARDAAPPFFENPLYSLEQSQLDRALRERSLRTFLASLDSGFDATHYLTRATGQPHQKLSDRCFFTGRSEELADLAQWMDDAAVRGHGLRVVTGGPGAGKSALLGMLVCTAHPQLASYAQTVVSRIEPAHRPSLNPGLLAVHARGLSLAEITDSVLRQLGRTGTGHSSLEDVFEALAVKTPASVLVLDALDESAEPVEVLNQLILPLVRTQTCGLLVGLRKWEEFEELFTAARAYDGLIDLDTLPEPLHRKHLADYVGSLLATEGSPYAGAPHRSLRGDIAATVAAALIDAQVTGGFLVAGLYAHHLLTQEEPTGLSTVRGDVPRSLGQVLELHLKELTDNDPFLRPVLAALGHARGEGMPRRLLAYASRAFLPSTTSVVPQESDIERALATISFYLRSSIGPNGMTVYRFFHQALADHMQERPDGDGYVHDHPADERRLFDSLLDSARPVPLEPVDWRRADPYLLRHAAEHGGRDIDRLLTNPEFLVHADASHLLPRLGFATEPRSKLAAAIYRSSSPAHLTAPAEERRHVLAFDAARWGDMTSSARLMEGGTAVLPWTCDLVTASGTRIGYVGALRGHDGPLRSLRMRMLGEDTTVVTVGTDGTVRTWDIRTTQQTEQLRLNATYAEPVTHQNINSVLVLHDGGIHTYRIPGMQPLRYQLHDPDAPITEFSVHPTARGGWVVTRNAAGVIRLRSLTDGHISRSLDRFPPGAPFAVAILPGDRLRIYIADNASNRIVEWNGPWGRVRTYVKCTGPQDFVSMTAHHQAWVTALLASDSNGATWVHPGHIKHGNWRDAHWINIDGCSSGPGRMCLLRGQDWQLLEANPSPAEHHYPGGRHLAFVAQDDGTVLEASLHRNNLRTTRVIPTRQRATHFDMAGPSDAQTMALSTEEGTIQLWQRQNAADIGRRDFLHESPSDEVAALASFIWRQSEFPENARDDIVSLASTGEIKRVFWKSKSNYHNPYRFNSDVFDVEPYRPGPPFDSGFPEIDEQFTLRELIGRVPQAMTLASTRMRAGVLLLAGCTDGTIRIWHRFNEAERTHTTIPVADGPITGIAVLRDGLAGPPRLAVAAGSTVRMITLSGPPQPDHNPWPERRVTRNVIIPGRITHLQPFPTPNGQVVVGTQEGAVLSIRSKRGTATCLISESCPEIRTVRTNGQDFALLGADGRAVLGRLGVRPQQPIIRRSLEATCVDLIELAGRPLVLVGCQDRSLWVFDPDTGEPVAGPVFTPGIPRVLIPMPDDHIAVGFGPDVAILRWKQAGLRR